MKTTLFPFLIYGVFFTGLVQCKIHTSGSTGEVAFAGPRLKIIIAMKVLKGAFRSLIPVMPWTLP